MSSSCSRPIFQGQLQKRGKINTAWKLRWCNLCTLKGGAIVLEYYDSQMSRNLCGTVDLSQVYSVEVISKYHDLDLAKQLPENVLLNTTTKSDQKYSFQISSSGRKYLFAAFDPPSFFSWISHLDKYIYGGVIKQGSMMKRGVKSRGWKKRYFVLNEYKQIKYYQDFEKTHFSGVIHLNKVSSIKNGKVYSDAYKFTLELITEKRIWILCCKDLKQRELWHKEIKKAIGAENLSNHMTVRMKHNVQIAHLKQQLSKISIASGTSVKLHETNVNYDNDDDRSQLSMDILLSPEALEMDYAYDCASIRNCKALKRITMNLHFYQTMIESNDDSYSLLLNYCQRNTQILNDYDHLLHHHLNANNRIESNASFEIINDSVRKYVSCDIENCKSYKRNVRNRHMDIDAPNHKHPDPHILFYIDLLDTMHTNFVHSFDIGLRINTSQCAYIMETNDDIEMSYIHNLLKIKRKSSWRLPPRHHRYCTMFTTHTHNISVDDDDEKAAISQFEDDYVKIEEIVIGCAAAFGTAYLCHKRDSERKLYTVQQMSKVKFYCIPDRHRFITVQSMKNEIEMMRVLKHKNVVNLHEIYEDRNFLYLVMEHLNGGQLFHRIYTLKVYTEAYVVKITKQILSALAYMQSNGICHFNLKPENIMFESDAADAEVKLIDFGTAQIVPKLTELKQNVGNVYYTAPEVLRGVYDRASDIWSVGVIVFCLLFGYPAFYVDENAFNYFGKKEEEDICELIKKGFNPAVREGHGPWFPKDVSVSQDAQNIISGMLKQSVSDRLSVTECLEHAWITNAWISLPKDIIFKRLSNFAETCKFKVVISDLFTKKLDRTNYTKTLQVFQQFSDNNSSEITLKQFKEGMKLTTDLMDDEIDTIFAHLDLEHDSRTLSIEELIVSSAFKALSSVFERMYQLLCEIDHNDNGMIHVDELKKVVHKVGEAMHVQHSDDIINKLNVNDYGQINYMDFLRKIHGLYNDSIRRGTTNKDIRKRYQFKEINVQHNSNINMGMHPIKTRSKRQKIAKQNQKMLRMDKHSFGLEFNYNDTNHRWYIKPKFNSLKQEILCDLTLNQYECALLKSKKFMDSDWIKRIKSKIDYNSIKTGDAITLQHVFVVILYTDYTVFHHMLKITFRRLSDQETDDAIIERNRAYHHFCKFLYETINIFESNEDRNNSSSACGYYHAMDQVVIPRSMMRVYGIISVTQQLEIVIAGMSDHNMNGMIVELPDEQGLNCNFLSCFSYENEKILFAPTMNIAIISVSVLLHDTWHNYRKYIYAIHVYHNVLNGKQMETSDKQPHFENIQELLQLDANKKKHYLQFVYQYFHLFCEELTEIKIDLKYIKQFNKGFYDHVVYETNNSLLRFNEIMKIYTNCKRIITQKNNGKSKVNVSLQYFDGLLSMIEDISYTNLEIINVINPNIQCTENEFTSFQTILKQHEWIMNYDKTKNKSVITIRKQ